MLEGYRVQVGWVCGIELSVLQEHLQLVATALGTLLKLRQHSVFSGVRIASNPIVFLGCSREGNM